jgi:pimeloyl-ACP methyl ester carboxylesterase
MRRDSPQVTDVVATPTWLDLGPEPIAAWVHRPADERVRGGVLICPPIGRESIIAYQSIRFLADQCARAGLLAVRIDYLGTGDSADPLAAGQGVAPWRASVQAGVEYLRRAGCESVSVVGLRLGANIALAAAPDCGPLTALVSWDPAASGRAFLREQRALQTLEIGPRPARTDGSQEALGFVYPADVLADLTAMNVASASLDGIDFVSSDNRPCLLLRRPEQQTEIALSESPLVEDGLADEQAELLNRRSFAAQIPRRTIAQIVTHLSGHAPASYSVVHPSLNSTAVVARSADGTAITERFTWLEPDGAFAVVTDVDAGSDVATAPTLLCANVAMEHHIGPGRAWVGFGRRAAERGIRTIRYDQPGVGDSVDAQVGDDIVLYRPEARQELARMVAGVQAVAPGPVGMLGSCSGAWDAATVGAELHLDAVWLINNIDWYRVPKSTAGVDEGARAERNSENRDAAESTRTRIRRLIKNYLPYPVWLALCRRGLFDTPEVLLGDLAAAKSKVRVLLSDTDTERFRRQRGDRAVARLTHRGADLRVTTVDADHALFLSDGRAVVLDQVLADAETDLAIAARPAAATRSG